MKRIEFLKSLLLSPAALIPKSITPKEDDYPVKEFRYQTPRRRAWVMFMKRGNPKPVWYYWSYPRGVYWSDYKYPKARNPGQTENLLDGEGWHEYEGVHPKEQISQLHSYMAEHFPDTSYLLDYVYLEWSWEEKQRNNTENRLPKIQS